ncbi:ABC transporter ATP-binding protein [Evansella halocellulosilytica]|uniref:ABC transporter ATP-binding protein n=1 Tax=Evansella halocellulosilytica TaxID=2011013 RepID=UPI001C53F561|nr:ABC transporter ATP-binding protein [Evansella halocellulosilytica]
MLNTTVKEIDQNADKSVSEKQPFIEINHLKKYYDVGSGFKDLFKKTETKIKAIDDVSLQINEGEILGLAGESGSGKTTTGEVLIRLQDPTAGEIFIDGRDIAKIRGKKEKEFRKDVQMIFQDPYETLNPRFTIFRTIAEPLKIQGLKDQEQIMNRVIKALEIAELRPAQDYLQRFPHELSGGQRQRVAIARGIVNDPKFIVADEPVSMLDVSIRAGILNLLKRLRSEMGLTMLYVSHDLSTIKYLCDRIAIMYLGKIVEIGSVNEVINNPQHPYTKTLLSAVPVADPDIVRERMQVTDEVPDQIHLPEGCRFTPRCPFATDECKTCDHELRKLGDDQFSACIYNGDELFNK